MRLGIPQVGQATARGCWRSTTALTKDWAPRRMVAAAQRRCGKRAARALKALRASAPSTADGRSSRGSSGEKHNLRHFSTKLDESADHRGLRCAADTTNFTRSPGKIVVFTGTLETHDTQRGPKPKATSVRRQKVCGLGIERIPICLVCRDRAAGASKLKEAEARSGVQVIDEDGYLKMIGGPDV